MAKRQNKSKASGGGFDDVYTVILALAFLALAGTATVVCLYGHQLYGAIFGLTAP